MTVSTWATTNSSTATAMATTTTTYTTIDDYTQDQYDDERLQVFNKSYKRKPYLFAAYFFQSNFQHIIYDTNVFQNFNSLKYHKTDAKYRHTYRTHVYHFFVGRATGHAGHEKCFVAKWRDQRHAWVMSPKTMPGHAAHVHSIKIIKLKNKNA